MLFRSTFRSIGYGNDLGYWKNIISQLRLTGYDHVISIEHEDGLMSQNEVYSFVNHNRTHQTVKVNPAQVIIIDGILILENKALRELMDVKVYVDTDADVRLGRRLLRDVQERGRSIESVLTQYFSTVKPMHNEFVEPSKRYADIIIPEGGFNSVALKILVQNIKSIIEKEKTA